MRIEWREKDVVSQDLTDLDGHDDFVRNPALGLFGYSYRHVDTAEEPAKGIIAPRIHGKPVSRSGNGRPSRKRRTIHEERRKKANGFDLNRVLNPFKPLFYGMFGRRTIHRY
jgi:hypothetical protein